MVKSLRKLRSYVYFPFDRNLLILTGGYCPFAVEKTVETVNNILYIPGTGGYIQPKLSKIHGKNCFWLQIML